MLKVQRSIFQGKAKSPTEMGVRVSWGEGGRGGGGGGCEGVCLWGADERMGRGVCVRVCIHS